jgi:hypothetical protein
MGGSVSAPRNGRNTGEKALSTHYPLLDLYLPIVDAGGIVCHNTGQYPETHIFGGS